MRSKTENFLLLSRRFRVSYDDDVVQSVIEDIEDVTTEEFDSACRRARKECRFMPQIAELRDMIEEQRLMRPVQQPKARAATRDEVWASCVRQDMDEMGMTEEEYAEFCRQYKVNHGEEWVPTYWHPELWNSDGTPRNVSNLAQHDAEQAI